MRSFGILLVLLLWSSIDAKPTISSRWDFLGPFPVGKTEIDGDPTAAFGTIQEQHETPRTYTSELVVGGKVEWSRIEANGGEVSIQPPVNWNAIVQSVSEMAALEFQGWAVGEVNVPKVNRQSLCRVSTLLYSSNS